MIFNSLAFAVFFMVVLFVHHLPLPWRVKKLNLMFASYLFYAAWNPPFLALLWVSTVVDWAVAQRMARASTDARRRALLMISLCWNLGALGFFKYANFLVDDVTQLLAMVGVVYHPTMPDIILPLGISFYTFQSLSYTIDVYLEKIKPWPSLLDYALFLAFFPRMVAGPIMRAAFFLPQCLQPRPVTASQFGWGFTLLVLGLFEKVVLADGILAPVADFVFAPGTRLQFVDAWTGTFAVSGQIFFDFAGYSTCAMGSGLCLGFLVPENFRFPYAAVGFSDFWRRWHISFSRWILDYIFMPLQMKWREWRTWGTAAALLMTFLASGIWHGAAWTFVFWGALHGFYLVAELLYRKWTHNVKFLQRNWVCVAGCLSTFVLISIAWMPFRARDFDAALAMLRIMMMPADAMGACLLDWCLVARVVLIMTGTLWMQWRLRNSSVEMQAERLPWWLRAVLVAAMIVALFTSPGEDRAFVYFQF